MSSANPGMHLQCIPLRHHCFIVRIGSPRCCVPGLFTANIILCGDTYIDATVKARDKAGGKQLSIETADNDNSVEPRNIRILHS